MKVWVSRDPGSRYVCIHNTKPTWISQENIWDYPVEEAIDDIFDDNFAGLTGIFVKEREALLLDVQAIIMERLTGEVES